MIAGRADRLRLLLAHAALIAFIALVTVPLFMVVSISFRKGNFAVGGVLPTAETFSLEHWRMVLGLPVPQADGTWATPSVSVLRWFWNSVKVSATSAFLILALSSTCAYAFARMRFRGRERILGGLLILQMFPMVLALIAIYSILEALGRWQHEVTLAEDFVGRWIAAQAARFRARHGIRYGGNVRGGRRHRGHRSGRWRACRLAIGARTTHDEQGGRRGAGRRPAHGPAQPHFPASLTPASSACARSCTAIA